MTRESARKRTGIRLVQAEGSARARACLAERRSEWNWRTVSKGQYVGVAGTRGVSMGKTSQALCMVIS